MTSHFRTLGSSLAVDRPASLHLDSSSRTFALIGPLCPPWRRPPSCPLWSPLPLRADRSMGCQYAVTLSRVIAWAAPVVESLGSFIKPVEYLMYLCIFFYVYKNAESEFLPGARELPVWMTGWLVVLGILRRGSGESPCCFSIFQWLPCIIFTLFSPGQRIPFSILFAASVKLVLTELSFLPWQPRIVSSLLWSL